jgi:23S rRNA pseudouridine1911/1915/1917 synthase
MRKGEWLQISTPNIPEELLFRWLTESFAFPEKTWRRLHASGGIQFARQRLSLRLFAAEPANVPAFWELPEVVFEDDFIMVVNKPAGVKVHPTNPADFDTLANRVAAHYEQTGQALAVRIVHRLDQSTSGLLVLAKNEFAQYRLDEMMRRRAIARTYVAVVHGVLKSKAGTMDAPIARDRHADRYRVTKQGGQAARTHYRVIGAGAHFSLLELTLDTGRTHQIRVHLSHLGHPLLGDTLYGGQPDGITRPALHARFLRFPHPWDGAEQSLAASIPNDMRPFFPSEDVFL